MANAYEYLFYRIYGWQARNWQSEIARVFAASLLLIALFFANLVFVWQLMDLVFGKQIPRLPHISRIEMTEITSALGFLHYFFWMHKGRYKNIAKKFEREESSQRRTRGIIVVIYFVLTFVSIIVAAIIGGWLSGEL